MLIETKAHSQQIFQCGFFLIGHLIKYAIEKFLKHIGVDRFTFMFFT